MRCFNFRITDGLNKMSDNGTPIEALESGDISNVADAAHMQNIIREMNASGAEVVSPNGLPPPQMGQMQPMPPMMPSMNAPMPPMPPAYQNANYIAVEEEGDNYYPTKQRKNAWSTAADSLRDPLIVTVLMFVLSLPVLHTFIGKYASWAFAVGGQLSWLGLILKSVLAGLLFAVFKGVFSIVGF